MITRAATPEKEENGGCARGIEYVIEKHRYLAGVFLELMLHMLRQGSDIF